MRAVALVFLVGWAAFWLYWLAASLGVKAGRSRSGRSIAVRAGILLVALVLVRARVFRGQAATNDPWLQGIGLALFVLGLALAIWARMYLGRNWGAPMSQKVDPDLVTTGPYRTIRHPIYSGIILALVGTAVAISWYAVIAVVLLGGYFVYSAIMEERYMITLFPDTYPAYMRSTKRLIPFVF